jgi:hypothetical protein
MRRPRVWMLLVLIAVLALPLSVAVNRYRAQQYAIGELRRLGADIEMKPGVLGQWWPTVVGVEAHGREFQDEGLALLTRLPEIQGLSLIGTQTTDDGLAHLVTLRRLEIIYLENIEVTDAGLNHLARMSSLRELRLSTPGRITDDGLRRLKRASPKLNVVEATFR